MKVAFLDRDGTIIKDYPDKDWGHIKTPEFLKNSIQALKHFKEKGFEIIIITNQYLIGENVLSLDDYNKFNDLILKTLKRHEINILDIFYCPHARNQNCNCMKPNPGLINQALHKYPNIDLSKSFYVGDSLCDKQLAEHFDLDFYGINLKCKNSIHTLNEVIV